MTSTNCDNWDACQPGDLNRVVKSLKDRRLVRALRRDCSIAAVLCCFVLSGYVVADKWESDVNLGGVVCYEVSKLSAPFITGYLPSDMNGCVQKHLSMCSHCRARIESIKMHASEGAIHRPTVSQGQITTSTDGIYHNPLLADSTPIIGFSR